MFCCHVHAAVGCLPRTPICWRWWIGLGEKKKWMIFFLKWPHGAAPPSQPTERCRRSDWLFQFSFSPSYTTRGLSAMTNLLVNNFSLSSSNSDTGKQLWQNKSTDTLQQQSLLPRVSDPMLWEDTRESQYMDTIWEFLCVEGTVVNPQATERN